MIVAYSGGADSASGVGGEARAGRDALAITADSASIPESHKRDAEAFVRRFGIRHDLLSQTGPESASSEAFFVYGPDVRHRKC